MKQSYRNKFPKWCSDSQNQYDLVLSDDIDSLLSCCLLQDLKGYRINYFYDFNNFYRSDKSSNEIIAVDIDFSSGKCWSNHVTMLNENDRFNSNAANLNIIDGINRNNYHQKYCGSTLLQIWSYYNIPLPASEEGKMILLAIDSSFKGFYSNSETFKNAHYHYIKDVLQFDELIELEHRHSIDEFYNLVRKYKLNGKIKIDNNKLSTNINLALLQDFFNFKLELPESNFESKKSFNTKGIELNNNKNYSTNNIKNLISCALTYKNFIKSTVAE